MSGEWKYGVLNDAVTKGSSNISLRKIKEEEGTYPVYGAKGFIKNVSFYQQEQEYLALIKDGAGIGRVSKHPARSSILATMQYIIPKEGFHIDFIKYFLKSLDFETYRTGSTIPHIYFKNYKNAKFPLVQLTEQQKIVTLLDEAFADIQQAQANIEQNIVNAKELFQSKLNEIFSQRGDGWEEKTLGEVCEVQRGSSPRPIKQYVTDDENGVNWIKIGDVGKDDKYVTKTKQRITKEGAEKSRLVNEGDFILSNSMSYGRPYIMKITGYIHDGWFVLRLPESLNSNYFWYLLSSPLVKGQFTSLAAGSVVKNIKGDLVKKAMLPIPPLAEQQKIVELLDKISNDSKLAVNLYQQKLDNLEELKKSLLEKAFSGALTRDSMTAS